ncbi:YicC/YloC family endoribonuclease [Phragmitibacter flavus]|nr:YicC/YloC family endoribonuclease [Phragmitibacter flavus]
MTGFGRGEAIADGVVWRAEVSSVNRKQLEIVVQLPRELGELEAGLRGKIAERLSRGRVQASFVADRGVGSATKLKVDEDLARQYADSLTRLGASLGLEGGVTATDAVRWPGVFVLEQSSWSAELALPLLEKAMEGALVQMLAMRRTEGANLKVDMLARLALLEGMLDEAGVLAPQAVVRLRDALRVRLEEAGLPLPLDDERLVKEIAMFADRCDISEEITRAASHIGQFRAYMESGEPVGRSLDFLAQELFREFNTMGSKANHAPLAQLIVRAKTELEKIREQVQNIE